jgi:hypothetical protein
MFQCGKVALARKRAKMRDVPTLCGAARVGTVVGSSAPPAVPQMAYLIATGTLHML